MLVVEDDPDLAEVTADLIGAEGFAVTMAHHGSHALALLEQGLRPDVIVCDMMMPVMDGFGFLSAYARWPEPRAPVLAVSAFESYLPDAITAGAAAALQKPYGAEALVSAVRALATGGPVAEAAPAPAPDERARLEAIRWLRLEEPAPTPELDRYAARVARLFEVPICLVSIVGEEAQSWHASCGLPPSLEQAGGTPRSASFCTHAVAARAALIVHDTAANPSFRDNPLVRTHGFRFYAGVPLLRRTGDALGTLCLLDFQPHRFNCVDLHLLGVLARRVSAELEQRELKSRPLAPASAFLHLNDRDEELDLLGRDAFTEAFHLLALRASAAGAPISVLVAVAPPARIAPEVAALDAAFPRAILGRLAGGRVAVAIPDVRAAEAQAIAGAAGLHAVLVARDVPPAPGAAVEVLRALEEELGDAGLTPRAEAEGDR